MKRFILIQLIAFSFLGCAGYEANDGDTLGSELECVGSDCLPQETPPDETAAPPVATVPTPSPTPTPTPTNTGTLNCTSTAEVLCDYGISAADMASTQALRATLTIPKGKILSSKFITSTDTTGSSIFAYQEVTGSYTQVVDLWISTTPGGEPVSSRCVRSSVGFIYSLSWIQFEDRYCVLRPSATYYVNMKHVDETIAASKIHRTVQK